ncbi:MAG: ATP-grasp domain-containing protein [Methylococcales bacterium]|nr:ATP-grasp domain-containing protein [Methylococcales bacterium]
MMNQFSLPARLLVVAQSGRMLAQLLRNAGFAPVVVDCFADADTVQLALEAVRVADLSVQSLRPVLADLRARYGMMHLVYGSGFEFHTDSLDDLRQDWQLLGNPPAVFGRVQDRKDFFRLLAMLAIPCPETVFVPPEDDGDWLQKPLQGQGGRGIVHHRPRRQADRADCYWQRRLDGTPMSLTFVAAADRVEVLGFNRQWTMALDSQPFRFAGIANRAVISAENRRLLCIWLGRLAAAYHLRGLGSLDFMLLDGCCHVLEINARIPASAQLYEPTGRCFSHAPPVFARHLQTLRSAGSALTDSLPVYDLADEELYPAAGYQIVFAEKAGRIPEAVVWPEWVADRPFAGAIVGKDQPICSIIAREAEQAQVLTILRRRRQFVENILMTGSKKHAISG